MLGNSFFLQKKGNYTLEMAILPPKHDNNGDNSLTKKQ